MELHALFIRKPGQVVQPIHILCDKSDELPLRVERLDKVMADIRLGVLVREWVSNLLFHASMRAASLATNSW